MTKLIFKLLATVTLLWAAPSGAAIEDAAWKGGTVNLRFKAWPKALNYLTASDVYTGNIWYHVGVHLLATDENTWTPLPWLAKKWEVSKDKKTFTFHLDADATWDDGTPITAEDVKFSFDLFWDAKRCVLCEPVRSYNGPIEYVKVINPLTVEIRTGDVHFEKLERLGSVYILPKSKYSAGTFDKDYDKVIYGGGPYVYDNKASEYRKTVVLNRRKNYWANKYEYFHQRFNFDKIVYKYVEDHAVAFEMFKRKELDYFYFEYDAYESMENRAAAPFTDKDFGFAQADKFYPSTWMGIAINMRSGIGADKKVRNAMQYLLNRQEMIAKVFKNHMVPAPGPFNRGSKYSSQSKPAEYSPEKAKALLKEAGFTKAGSDGYLYREVTENGKTVQQRASFTVLFANLAHEKWMTMYKEDAKKAGVEINPRFMEWSAMTKLMEEYKFDALVMGWSGDIVPAPEQLFDGKVAGNKGSSNYPGINIAELNKLMEDAPGEFNEKKRIEMFQRMEKILIDENPYVYRWVEKNHYVAYWKDRLNPTDKAFLKYSGDLNRRPFHFHWRAVKK